MYLSKLEIVGFKSFAQKTVLKFNEGITAIVGPNGCGKSNIIDAIRWAIGEQKASTLRSDKMEEVIFNGTSARKPLGMSEVSLTIENTKGILPTEYSEVTLTRRLFRSGDSEYLLNKTQCRLRDIIDLFMDTGMGANAYSVIELKMVETILSENADERRKLFEEAAGVTKYKVRRKEALRRLDSTKQDLLRVADILKEVSKKVNSLERQAKRAQEYTTLDKQRVELEVEIIRREFLQTVSRIIPLNEKLQSFNSSKNKLDNELHSKETILKELENDQFEIENILNEAQKDVTEISSRIAELNQKQAVSSERLRALNNFISRSEKEVIESQNKISNYNSEKENFAKKLIETKEKLSIIQLQFNEANDSVLSYENELIMSRDSSKKAQLEVVNIINSVARLRGEEIGNISRKDSINKRLNNFLNLKEEILLKKNNAELSLIEVYTNVENEKAELERSRKEFENSQDLKNKYRSEIDAMRNEIVEVHKQLNTRKSRLDFLAGLVDQDEAVRFLSKDKSWNPNEAVTVSDVISTSDEYRVAISVALGTASSCLIVNNIDQAMSGVASLKLGKKGKATFICLDRIKENDTYSNRTLPDYVIGYALNLTKSDTKFDSLRGVLLGDVVIVNSIENAKRAIATNICERAVTLDGTTVQASGIVRGGGTTSNEGVTIGKKEQIEKLLTEIDKLTQKLEKLESDSRVISTYESVINLSEISNAVRLAQESLGNIEKVRNRLEYEKNNADEVIINNEKEVQSLQEEIKSLDIILLEISPKIETLSEDQKLAEENVRVVNLQLSAKETEFSEKMRILNSLNVQLTELRNEDRNSLNSIDRLDSDLRNTQNFITQRISDKERSVKEVDLITNDLKQISDGLILFNASLENSKINRDEIISEQSNKRLEIIQRSDLLRSDRKSYESTVSEIHTLELKIQELNQKASSLIERAKDELDIDLLKLIEDLKFIEEKKLNNNYNLNDSIKTIINDDTNEDTIESGNSDVDLKDIDSDGKVFELVETETTDTSIVTFVDSELTVVETFESISSETITSELSSNLLDTDLSIDLSNIESTLTEFRDKLREVKSRIKILGTVNLLAYQEWKEEDDRLKFINVQYNDLRKAEKILLDTIDEINNIAQRLFIETFEKIRLNFIGLFGNLFNEGDEADLKIMEGDPLEAKIEIIAKPRGKRPHSIDLLSGGEKTLTAIALLFSIYLVKPSPFCILDEVDAPLDDTNIDRFVNLIRKFVGNTQFIIVTHNKRTMAAADTMYGVTQEESGVSKIVSVQFENKSKQEALVN